MRLTAPRWTQDDILLAAAETFALLPRPSGAAVEAFTALLLEYWPSTGAETREKVEALLRGSRRCSPRVIEMLDFVSAPVAKRVQRSPESERPQARAITVTARQPVQTPETTATRGSVGARQTVSPPPLVEPESAAEGFHVDMVAEMNDQDRMMDEEFLLQRDAMLESMAEAELPSEESEDAAAHARALLRRVALTGERGPVIQPRSIADRLDASDDYAATLADLLHLPREDGGVVLSNVPGTLIALRTLGVSAGRAVRLVARWHGVEPAPLLPAYRGLRLTQCLDAVADWRNIAARADEVANDDEGQERAAQSA